MMGRFLIVLLVGSAVVAGAAIYYLQVYAFYHEVAATGPEDVQIVALATDTPEPIAHSDFRAIDAESSPIRYRACFSTTVDPKTLGETHRDITGATPRNAPSWFHCFDAKAIAQQIESGTAHVFMGAKNVHYGVDRIVAITDDGQGFAWHELNECGEKSYDGTVIGEECPPRPDTQRTD